MFLPSRTCYRATGSYVGRPNNGCGCNEISEATGTSTAYLIWLSILLNRQETCTLSLLLVYVDAGRYAFNRNNDPPVAVAGHDSRILG